MAQKILAEIQHNAYLKTYPNGSVQVCATDVRVFRERGWEESDKWDFAKKEKASTIASAIADNLDRSIRRARSKVRDYALSNDFRYFVTLTLDNNKLDRYDIYAISHVVQRWLSHAVQRHGLKYIIVPEYHKDGAIHFHGLFNDALSVVDSGTLTDYSHVKPFKPRSQSARSRALAGGAHIVYNLPQWSFGFSTAIELYDDREKAVGYVCKYIGKQREDSKIGGRWYLSGGCLCAPCVETMDIDYQTVKEDMPERCFVASGLNREMCKFEMGVDEWTEYRLRITR